MSHCQGTISVDIQWFEISLLSLNYDAAETLMDFNI